MANLTVTRTHVGSILNHQQVGDGLDSLGDAGSKKTSVTLRPFRTFEQSGVEYKTPGWPTPVGWFPVIGLIHTPEGGGLSPRYRCKEELEIAESVGENVAGVDLGISNIAAVAFPDEYVLYPGNTVKEDKHYFTRAEYDTEGENGPSETAAWARRKLSR